MEPTVGMAEELRTDPASLAADAQSVARGLHRLVEGDLAGMFDGESTATVDWSGPGIVVDLSAVLQSPAFSSILVCAGAWLAQVVARKDRQRIIVVDECWKAIRDAGFVAWGEETQKLSRGYGVQFVTIVQRISDLASQADDGTATAKRAQGFVTEAETKVTFNLSGGEAKASRRRHGLDRVGDPARAQAPPGAGSLAGGGARRHRPDDPVASGHRHVRQQPGHAEPRMTARKGALASPGPAWGSAFRSGWCSSARSMPPSPTPPALTPGSPGWGRRRPPIPRSQRTSHQWRRVRTAQPNGWPRSSSRPPDTTDPTHPEGDTAERAALAPGLTVPRRVVWPEAWVAEDRRTTVVLDPPGPVVAVGTGQVAVVVTGRTVVTTDTGRPSEVPVDERITLRPTGPTGTANGSASVTDVGSGS